MFLGSLDTWTDLWCPFHLERRTFHFKFHEEDLCSHLLSSLSCRTDGVFRYFILLKSKQSALTRTKMGPTANNGTMKRLLSFALDVNINDDAADRWCLCSLRLLSSVTDRWCKDNSQWSEEVPASSAASLTYLCLQFGLGVNTRALAELLQLLAVLCSLAESWQQMEAFSWLRVSLLL